MEKREISKDFGHILVLVPHQDDEILMTAGVISKAVELGVRVNVVIATNGDYECADYSKGRRRLKESLTGLMRLGVAADAVTFLGYADTGMPEEESFLGRLFKEQEEEKLYPSLCSEHTYGLEEKADFHTERFGYPAQYNRKNFKDDLKAVLTHLHPEHIFTTSDADAHGDHKGLHLFLMEVLGELQPEQNYQPEVYGAIVHSMAGDDNWPLRSEQVEFYTCPPDFERTCAYRWDDRVSFEVPVSMQSENHQENVKYQALSGYQTALEPKDVDYLYSFIKKEELFWKATPPSTR